MIKVFTYADSFKDADEKDFEYYASLSSDERLKIALQLMEPIYDAYPRLERLYRIIDQAQRPVSDSWRMGGK